MSRTLSTLAISSQNTHNTDEVWLVLLRIEHASITPGGVIRVVNNIEDITGGYFDKLRAAPVSRLGLESSIRQSSPSHDHLCAPAVFLSGHCHGDVQSRSFRQ